MALAVVTGAGSGIGAAIAQHAAKTGYEVAVWDLDGDAATAVASGIGGKATARQVDITSADSLEDAFTSLPDAPALLVNNAGIVRFGPLLDLSEADWRSVLDVNLTGTFLTSRAAAARMIAAGGGAIVNISSVNGISAAPNAGAYTSTKGAINTLTEQMALEWGPRGVRVNAVAPGLIDAGMSEAIYADPQVRELRQSRVPLGTLGSAEDIAGAALFLGSDAAGYINGQVLVVDGGLTKSAMLGLARPQSVDSVGVDS